jgi:putative tryptophan/tyrosine transport system substrate-binding protein
MKTGNRGGQRRRDLFELCAAAFLASGAAGAWPLAAHAEPSAKIPRVGILSPAENEATPEIEAFRKGLRELGYVEGRNIILEYRFAGGDYTVLRRLAEELADLPVDIIVTDGPAGPAAAGATRTTPIVLCMTDDSVALGLVNSFGRPGGNVTGFTSLRPELSGKRVDLMRTAFPRAMLATVLLNPSGPSSAVHLRVTEETARALGLTVTRVEAASLGALRALRPEALGEPGGPILVLPDSMFWHHHSELLALVATAGVPSIYPGREYADDGGLMSYGANVPDNFRRAADYVDRILRGAKPGDLPIQRPVRFDFVVNLKTAHELGLTIPQSILARADEVIE